MSVADTRAFLAACGGDLMVGASTHDEAASATALSEGADFLVLGAIFPTASHPGEPGRGVELLRRVASGTVRPVLAIGGIDADRIPAVLAAGARGAVVSSAVWSDDEPIAAVERLLSAIEAWNRSE
jgi:thiamine-phosphate pyrophosphorylase